jgi:hypothetical protein
VTFIFRMLEIVYVRVKSWQKTRNFVGDVTASNTYIEEGPFQSDVAC